jgi:hypothetical protein
MRIIMGDIQQESFLLQLPAELVQHILTFLPAVSLGSLARTCSLLHQHTLNEQLWLAQVQQSLPGTKLTKAYHGSSFRDLYIMNESFLFLPKYKIWFSDTPHTGKLLIARYSHSRQTIEAYALAAERGASKFEFWQWNKDVIIHSFEPNVQLDLNRPILKLTGQRAASNSQRLEQEIPMPLNRGYSRGPTIGGFSSMFMHTRDLPPAAISHGTQVWPPQTLPAISRTRNASREGFSGSGHRPTKRSEMSESSFRIVNRMNYPSPLVGVRRVGEHVDTYATLPPESYTPTKAKPWRGIWCGDYSGHGCEFLAVLQPDKPQKLPEGVMDALEHNRRSVSPASESSWQTAVTSQDSDVGDWEQGSVPQSGNECSDGEANVLDDGDGDVEYSGQLMAVKLYDNLTPTYSTQTQTTNTIVEPATPTSHVANTLSSHQTSAIKASFG